MPFWILRGEMPFMADPSRSRTTRESASAIKRPKDMCACAISAHSFGSVERDFEIWLARSACVQSLHTEGISFRSSGCSHTALIKEGRATNRNYNASKKSEIRIGTVKIGVAKSS